MRTAERTLGDLLHPLQKVLPEKRRLMLLAVTDLDRGA